jgi:hypothetical protein
VGFVGRKLLRIEELLDHATIGVDVGRKVDPTAIAVSVPERRVFSDYASGQEESEIYHRVTFLRRLPLRTEGPEVVRLLERIVRNLQERGCRQPMMYVDATGSGTALLVDHVRASLRRNAKEIVPVYFNKGDRRIFKKVDAPSFANRYRELSLGKAWMVSRMQSLLDYDRLLFPRDSVEAPVMVQELLDYEIRLSENANESYGAFKVGSHDDLVTSSGLATQEDPRTKPPVAAMSAVEGMSAAERQQLGLGPWDDSLARPRDFGIQPGGPWGSVPPGW